MRTRKMTHLSAKWRILKQMEMRNAVNSERVHSRQNLRHHHLLVEEEAELAVEDAAPALLLVVDQLCKARSITEMVQ